ncbi:MAG TPA: hypothetical protein VK809_12780, partial [Bacteroidia bacterium]|nr:hypothetical protein [Bacteroidia bacterium]
MKKYIFLFTALIFLLSLKANAQCSLLPVGPNDSDQASFNFSIITAATTDKNGNLFLVYSENGEEAVREFTGGVWKQVGSPNFLNTVAADDIAISPSGTPYVMTQDGSNQATVMKFNGSNWGVVGGYNFSAGTITNPKIVTDTAGNPYVLYSDNAHGKKATVMTYNGSGWVNVGIAGFSSGSIGFTSLAFNHDTLYAAYGCTTGGIQVMKFNGTAWVSAAPLAFPSTAPYYVGMGFDQLDSLYLTFEIKTPTFHYGCFVLKFNGVKWDTVGGGIVAPTATCESIGFDNINEPCVAYIDTGYTNKLNVQKFNGVNWSFVGQPNFSIGWSFDLARICFDNSGVPYVACSDYGNANKSDAYYLNGNNWQIAGTVGISAGGTLNPSLATYGADTLFLAYTDTVCREGYRGIVKKFNGSSWSIVGDSDFSAKLAEYYSMAVSTTGVPYVAYTDGARDYKVTVKKFNGLTWDSVGNQGFSSKGAAPSLAIDASGIPYVAYSDSLNTGRAIVKKFNGTIWINVGPPDFSKGEALSVILKLDNSGTPYVAYLDDSINFQIRVCRFNGTSWDTLPRGPEPSYMTDWSFALDNANNPYIAFDDQTASNKLSVQEYNGSSWGYIGNKGFSPSAPVSYNVCLAVYNPGLPAVSFTADLMAYTGGSWV